PHDVLIQSEPDESFAPATVNYTFNLGWEGQAELVLKDNQKLIVKLERDQFDSLGLRPQQEVYVKPARAKVFAGVS
ncbi:MAG: TOBE domain-containing protein, partial [Pseudanabaena sp.]